MNTDATVGSMKSGDNTTLRANEIAEWTRLFFFFLDADGIDAVPNFDRASAGSFLTAMAALRSVGGGSPHCARLARAEGRVRAAYPAALASFQRRAAPSPEGAEEPVAPPQSPPRFKTTGTSPNHPQAAAGVSEADLAPAGLPLFMIDRAHWGWVPKEDLQQEAVRLLASIESCGAEVHELLSGGSPADRALEELHDNVYGSLELAILRAKSDVLDPNRLGVLRLEVCSAVAQLEGLGLRLVELQVSRHGVKLPHVEGTVTPKPGAS